MTLINRFGRLFKADVNAILDNLEEPEQILKQALRDMETAIINEKEQLKALNLHLNTLENFHQKNTQLMIKIQSELQLCLDANNESLCKTLIRKKLTLQSTLDHSIQKIDKVEDDKARQKQSISEMQQSISEITQKVAIVSEKNSPQQFFSITASEHKITNEEVEIEWLRLQKTSSKNPKKRQAS